jgi:hypothetical protein
LCDAESAFSASAATSTPFSSLCAPSSCGRRFQCVRLRSVPLPADLFASSTGILSRLFTDRVLAELGNQGVDQLCRGNGSLFPHFCSKMETAHQTKWSQGEIRGAREQNDVNLNFPQCRPQNSDQTSHNFHSADVLLRIGDLGIRNLGSAVPSWMSKLAHPTAIPSLSETGFVPSGDSDE